MRTHFVVVAPPARDFNARIGRLVNQCSFKHSSRNVPLKLDVAVLHWTAWLDQQVDDLVLLRPRRSPAFAGELRPVVGSGTAPDSHETSPPSSSSRVT